MASRLSRFLKELKRRKVYRVAVTYLVVGAILGGVANDFLPRLSAPDWTVGGSIFLILLGFPVALVLAWAYEVRPEERKEDASAEPSGRWGGRGIGAIAVTREPAEQGAGETSGGRKATGREGDDSREGVEEPLHVAEVAEKPPAEKPTIAVLPFEDFSPNPDDAYFAGGMHEEILTQLQKVGGLAVRARTSVLRYRENPKPVPEIARELGVQYILEGSA